MLQITPQHRIFIAIDPVDFRRGIDGLAATCRRQLEQDPFSGCLFAFRNKRGTAIKLLIYDGNGFWLCQKRFSTGKLKWWPRDHAESLSIRAVEFMLILQQGNPGAANVPPDWRQIK
jgi:transposase